MDSVSQKVCTKCGQLLPLDQFVKNSKRPDGRGYHCKPCHTSYHHQAMADPEKRDRMRIRSRDYYRNNDEARERNRIAGSKRSIERYYNDPEYRQRRYERVKQGYKTKPAWRAVRNAWQRANNKRPEVLKKRLVLWHRRRDKIRGSADHFTHEEWDALCARYNHCCLACGESVRLTPDHIIPVSKGGSNGIENIQPLCLPCNLAKGVKTTDYRY